MAKNAFADLVLHTARARWNGLTPAQAANANYDNVIELCPKGYTFVLYDIKFYFESFSWIIPQN